MDNSLPIKDPSKISNLTGPAKKYGDKPPLKTEDRLDTAFAVISMMYLLLMLAFFFWQLFDVWIGKYLREVRDGWVFFT